MSKKFVPITPGGTVCDWLACDTEEDAWEELLSAASHMPYDGKEGFIKRGYEVCELALDSDQPKA